MRDRRDKRGPDEPRDERDPRRADDPRDERDPRVSGDPRDDVDLSAKLVMPGSGKRLRIPRFVKWVVVIVVIGLAAVTFVASQLVTLREKAEAADQRALDRATAERECLARWAEVSTEINRQQDALGGVDAASERELWLQVLDVLSDPRTEAREQLVEPVRRRLKILSRVDRIPEYPTLAQTCGD